MNARSTIAIAVLLCGAAGCAATQTPPGPSAATQALPGQGREEFRFMGYRLEVNTNDRGTPTGATAFDPQGKQVPATIIELRELSVCVPTPAGASAGQAPHCEPASFMPERTQFKSGTQTLCYIYVGGKIIYYPC